MNSHSSSKTNAAVTTCVVLADVGVSPAVFVSQADQACLTASKCSESQAVTASVEQ